MNGKNLVIIFTLTFQLMMVLMLNQVMFATDAQLYYKSLPVIILSFLIMILTLYFALRYIEYFSKKEVEYESVNSHLKETEELLNTLRSERHQHSQHIQTIQAMIYTEEYDELKRYLSGIAGNYRSTGELLRLGDLGLTAVLNIKMETAKRNNINFYVESNGNRVKDLKMSSWELSTVIGNVLDNAIEAVMERSSDRTIHLELQENEKSFIFKISDNGLPIKESDIHKIYDAGFSTKHKDVRGFGLYVVRKIINKYHGKISVSSYNGMTTFTLFLPKKGGVTDASELFPKTVTDNNFSSKP